MNTNDSKSNQQEWPYPDSLDALIAAPEHHTLVFENEFVRVLDTRIAPGEVNQIHTHQWPCVVYSQSWSDVVRRDADGNVIFDTRQLPESATPPKAIWSDPLPPHTLENVGDQEFWIITVELKQGAATATETD